MRLEFERGSSSRNIHSSRTGNISIRPRIESNNKSTNRKGITPPLNSPFPGEEGEVKGYKNKTKIVRGRCHRVAVVFEPAAIQSDLHGGLVEGVDVGIPLPLPKPGVYEL